MAASEWSEKKKMVVTAAVGAVLCLAEGMYLNSLYGEWRKASKDHEVLQGEIKTLQGLVSEGPLRQAELDKKKIETSAKESKLPEGEKMTDLINEVSRLATKWKCDQISITFQPGTLEANKNYVKDVWHTRWKADFFYWCKFMNEMEERFPRFVAFEAMNFTVANSGMIQTGTKHEIAVDIVTYRYAKRVSGGTP